MNLLEIKNLTVELNGRKILSNLNLVIKKGEFHTIMGPNGVGKSTLAKTIMGHSDCVIKNGDILFKGKSILKLPTNERTLLGISLVFQQPATLEGVTLSNLLFQMVKKRNPSTTIFEFNKNMKKLLEEIGFDNEVLKKQVNKDFSGGEKKKSEILQTIVQKPELVILDEMDSGLDVDTMKNLAERVNELKKKGVSGLVITHYNRLLNHLKVDKVHVLKDGEIVLTGGLEVAERIEKQGYVKVEA